jgi:hypothetical protein
LYCPLLDPALRADAFFLIEISLAILCVFYHFSAVCAIVCCDLGLLNLLDGLSGSFSVFLSNADTL